MKITKIAPYSGPVDADGLVAVYDIAVADWSTYRLGAGVIVSNSKRVSMMDVNALLSHGAIDTLRDAGLFRGQQNEEMWLQFMQGHTPRDPKTPQVYEKFVNTLRAAGIHVAHRGTRTHVMALTNKDVDHMAGDRRIENGETVHFDKGMKPVPGGLFDPSVTGGHAGNLWSSIDLDEPMVNPVMEEPVRRLLGLTQDQFAGVISGDHNLPGGGTGPKAIFEALNKMDLDRDIEKARAEVAGGSKSKRDIAVRKLGYLKAAKQLQLHPREWVLNRAPVLPPIFRPVGILPGDTPMVADANTLYKDLIDANKNLKEMKSQLGPEHVGPERLALYHAFKAVTGLGDPITAKSRDKGVKGLLEGIFGETAKHGFAQRKLLSTTVDNVGRAVVSPNPDFDMDTLGIPEQKAFDVYGKFLIRQLRRRGMPIGEALRHVRDRTALAKDMLQKEMEERPVYMNRAPVHHKFGIMAFRPRIVAGDVLQVSPFIVKGMGMDFDGDTSQFHVPTTPEAVREAYDRMLPSKNLLAVSDFKTPMYSLSQEYLAGLYAATQPTNANKRPHVFATVADVQRAHARGDIGIDDPVQVLES